LYARENHQRRRTSPNNKRQGEKARTKLSNTEKEKFTNLLHFNAEIFEEITGIKVNEELEEMTLAQVCEKL